MKVAGSYRMAQPRERVFALLQDPVVLAKCMPGCDELVETAPGEYSMKMKMALASLAGLFDGKVAIRDSNPPESFQLIVDGKGKIGFMKGVGALTLSELEGATTIQYDGDVSLGGTLAAVGQRMVDTTSKMMIRKFFEKLEEIASA